MQVTVYPPQKKPQTRKKNPSAAASKSLPPATGYAGGRENSPALRLLKLSTHGVHLMGGAGAVAISWTDVALCLGSQSPQSFYNSSDGLVIVQKALSSDAYYFGLAKYCEDPQAIRISINNTICAARQLAISEGWKIEQGREILPNASKLALGMHLDLKTYCWCRFCGGTGLNRKGTCRHCQGSCKRELRHAELARIIGVSQTNYSTTWHPRIHAITRLLEAWDKQVLSHLYFHFNAVYT